MGSTCGKSPKSNKLRSRSTCVSSNTTVTSNSDCVMLYQFEEAKECEYIKKSDMDMLTPRIKIIASLGSWSVLFTVIIASAIMLRKKGTVTWIKEVDDSKDFKSLQKTQDF